MSLRAEISRLAETDLANQYRWYLDHANLEIAERFLSAFDARVKDLQIQPDLGRLRRFHSPQLAGIRSLSVADPFWRHLIFYRADETTLSIDRVMHGARNLPKRLTEPPEDF